MKTQNLLMAAFCILISVSCGPRTDKEYLSDVLQKMNKVESVSYKVVRQAWLPGEKDPVYTITSEVYEHINPQDTAIGSSFVEFQDNAFRGVYDGKVSSYVYEEEGEKWIREDDFTTKSPLPFRMVMPEFFYYTQSILKYAITTQDSIELSLKDLGDDYLMELTIHMPVQVEFFGKARYMPQNPYVYDPTSVYKIWISKKDDMPYRYRREMEGNMNEASCSDFIYNPVDKECIVATNYYPEGFEIVKKRQRSSKPIVDMTGKKAPDWTLTDMKGQKVSLSGIKSKVILLQFTGIGCGPCKISIPFLNRLKKEYAVNELEVLAVETWGRSKSSCEAYVKNQGIEYSFLTADKETIAKLINDYQAGSGVPQFYLIGKDRTIIAKFQGYAEKTTDTEIEKKIKANL